MGLIQIIIFYIFILVWSKKVWAWFLEHLGNFHCGFIEVPPEGFSRVSFQIQNGFVNKFWQHIKARQCKCGMWPKKDKSFQIQNHYSFTLQFIILSWHFGAINLLLAWDFTQDWLFFFCFICLFCHSFSHLVVCVVLNTSPFDHNKKNIPLLFLFFSLKRSHTHNLDNWRTLENNILHTGRTHIHKYSGWN